MHYLHAHCDFDTICVVLSPQNPLKEKKLLLDEEKRCEMVKAWVDTIPFAQCSTIEFDMPRPSYTYLTLRRFRELQPEVDFSLVMGTDSLVRFHLWRCYEEILRYHPVYVYPREGYPFSPESAPVLWSHPEADIRLVSAPLYPYSSTDVRRMLAESGCADEALPTVVAAFIRTHGLYVH